QIPCSPPAKIWPVGQVVKTPPFHGGNTGSNPVRVTLTSIVHVILKKCSLYDVLFIKKYLLLLNFGGLAQLGEHLPYKQGVAGSSPASSTMIISFNLVKKIRKTIKRFR